MIEATTIMLDRVEGMAWECGPKTFTGASVWTQAHHQLVAWRHTVNPGPGYDKIDFVVTFADGETYKGRFDLYPWSTPGEFPDLVGQVRRHVDCAINPPERFAGYSDEWKRPHLGDPVEWQRFADTYQIGDQT